MLRVLITCGLLVGVCGCVLRPPNGPFRARLSEQQSNTYTHAQIKCTHTHVAAKSRPELSQTYCLGQEKHFVYA